MRSSSERIYRLTWSQVREHFNGEWVELISYEWDWNSPYPRWATIRHHASDRSELLSMIHEAGRIPGGIVLHVGRMNSFISFDSVGAAI